uniref:Uncharacterized protein n=1 Tax=Aegilops tauschii subsp. strangulata TaxID=200361 RepID=A0A453Q4D3_AEGTS
QVRHRRRHGPALGQARRVPPRPHAHVRPRARHGRGRRLGPPPPHHRARLLRHQRMGELQDMIGVMEETTAKMLGDWSEAVAAAGRSAGAVVDVERGVVRNAAEIIARASFGIGDEGGARVFQKLQAMQTMLFRSNRLVGVPLARLLH